MDGSGSPSRRADVAIVDGRIVQVGECAMGARETIDAGGLVVAPGFVDLHTHLDAQSFWDPWLLDSGSHGVTTVVMGNCGFTPAPCRDVDRSRMADYLARVEGISSGGLRHRVPWNWETFPQYLGALARQASAVHRATYVGHSALRMFVMGERAHSEAATAEEIGAMSALAREALQAGAFGLSTCRRRVNRIAGDLVPPASALAGWDEMLALASALRGVDDVTLQIANEPLAGDLEARRQQDEQLLALARASGATVTWSLFAGSGQSQHRHRLSLLEQAHRLGLRMHAQVLCRRFDTLFGLRLGTPFDEAPGWPEWRALLRDEAIRQLHEPATHDRLACGVQAWEVQRGARFDWARTRPLQGTGRYGQSLAELAALAGLHPARVLLSLLRDVSPELIFATTQANENPADVLELLRHPHTLVTASDAGATPWKVADGSMQVDLLSHGVRETGEVPLETAVHWLTRRNALAVGIRDRGLIRPGLAADLIVFDPARIGSELPQVAEDSVLGPRLMQQPRGLHRTVVAGEVTWRDGEATAARPGRLLRRERARIAK